MEFCLVLGVLLPVLAGAALKLDGCLLALSWVALEWVLLCHTTLLAPRLGPETPPIPAFLLHTLFVVVVAAPFLVSAYLIVTIPFNEEHERLTALLGAAAWACLAGALWLSLGGLALLSINVVSAALLGLLMASEVRNVIIGQPMKQEDFRQIKRLRSEAEADQGKFESQHELADVMTLKSKMEGHAAKSGTAETEWWQDEGVNDWQPDEEGITAVDDVKESDQEE